MNIPLLDLKSQYQSMRSEILAAIEAGKSRADFALDRPVPPLDPSVLLGRVRLGEGTAGAVLDQADRHRMRR